MAIDTSRYVPDFLIKIAGVEFRHGTTIDVMSVTITETINRADTFEFKLRGRHPRLENFPSGGELTWIDDERFDPGKEVEIEMGYRRNRAVKLVGKITASSVQFPENGVPALSVQGQSLYNELFRQRRTKPFASQDDDAIVSEIAGLFNLRPVAENTGTRHKTVSYKGKTYAAILQERAERLNFEVAVKGRELFFQRPRYFKSTSAAQTLTWGRDLLSFSPRLNTSNVYTEVETRGTQTALGGKKKPIVARLTAAQLRPRLGKVSGPSYVKRNFGNNELLSNDHRAESPEEADKMSNAKMERSAIEFITADGATIGNPQLLARTVVEVKAVGKRFSGKYYVTSTTHTIDGGGYRTTFSAKRDAL